MSAFYITIRFDSKNSFRNEETKKLLASLSKPASLFQALPNHTPALISKRRDTLLNHKSKDYRFGPIRIDWIDFGDMNASSLTKQEKTTKDWSMWLATKFWSIGFLLTKLLSFRYFSCSVRAIVAVVRNNQLARRYRAYLQGISAWHACIDRDGGFDLEVTQDIVFLRAFLSRRTIIRRTANDRRCPRCSIMDVPFRFPGFRSTRCRNNEASPSRS